MKKGKFQKHSVELDEVSYTHVTLQLHVNFVQFQKLADKNITEVETILALMKKSAASR